MTLVFAVILEIRRELHLPAFADSAAKFECSGFRLVLLMVALCLNNPYSLMRDASTG